jgi:hypothetical protein
LNTTKKSYNNNQRVLSAQHRDSIRVSITGTTKKSYNELMIENKELRAKLAEMEKQTKK